MSFFERSSRLNALKIFSGRKRRRYELYNAKSRFEKIATEFKRFQVSFYLVLFILGRF